MIVKNETRVIERCLNSVKPIIDYWVIVDTGSTDGTQELIKKCMKDIPGEMHERAWKNFGHNRNEALDLARQKGDYILLMDADDYLEFSPGFSLPELTQDGYLIKIQIPCVMFFYRTLVINAKRSWKWVGALHEELILDSVGEVPQLEGLVNYDTREGFRSQNPKKYEEDAKTLEEALKEEPNNSRWVFYLAQSYRDAHLPEKSVKWYAKRAAMGGWPEEIYISLLNIALQNRSMKKSTESVIWDFYKAFTFRPHRPEAMYYLVACYLQQGRYDMAYLLLKSRTFIIQLTQQDTLFIENWIEDYGLLFELSVASYWIGEYQESLEASNTLLAMPILPEEIRKAVIHNHQCAVDKLATASP